MRYLYALPLFLLLFASSGCLAPSHTGDDDDDSAAGDDDDDSAAGDDDDSATGDGTPLDLLDEHNYSFEGTLDILSYELAEYDEVEGGDVTFDWSGLTEDLQGHTLDPSADIDSAQAVIFRYLSQEEVEVGLSENTLEQADVGMFVSTPTEGATSCSLSDMTMLGTDVDIETYFVDGYGTWLLSLATGIAPGVGTRMAAFVQPTPGAVEDTLVITNDSTDLQVTVDLTSIDPVSVPADDPAIIADWSQVTLDGRGNDIEFGDLDQLMIGHYEDLGPADLEQQFLDIELIAEDIWLLDLTGGTTANLSAATNDSGAFPGVGTSGTWILALRCMTCANPAPPYLALIEGS